MSASPPAIGATIALLDAAAIGPLRQGPGRTFVAVSAIALGVALGFSVYLINRVAADEVELASRSLFGMADLSVRAPHMGFDEELYPRLARMPGVAVASPVVEARARMPGHARPLQIVGIDPFRAARLQPAVAAAGASASQGSGLLAENSIWLSPSAAQAYGLAVGDEFDIQVALDVVTLRVAGLLPPGDYRQPLGMMDIATAQWRLDRLGRLDRVDLRLAPGGDPQAVRAAIGAVLPPGVALTTPGEASDDAVRLSRAYRSNLTALALVALFTGAFLVYATQSLTVARRRREIALLHAMGMTVREQLGASLLSRRDRRHARFCGRDRDRHRGRTGRARRVRRRPRCRVLPRARARARRELGSRRRCSSCSESVRPWSRRSDRHTRLRRCRPRLH